MALKISDDLANAMLDAMETLIGTAAKFQVWSGTVPTDESAAPGGTKLVEMTLPSDWLANANAGVKSKAGTWSGTGLAAGTATFFRLCTSAGTSKFQGSLTATGGGGDATIDNTNIASGQTVTVTSFSVTAPHL